MEMNIQNTCEFKNPVFERVFDGVTETPVTETVYVWGTDLSGSMQGAGGVGGLLAVKRDGVWYAPLYDANGHQKSAKPKGNPLGDRDFIAVPKGQSEERYPATQRQLYVTAYVSETGAVVAEYEYDAFGNTLTQSGSLADSFRHRFSTKPWIAALGVYDYGERVYSPELRRWLSRDPIEEEGGANLYAMCGNDAVNGVDPLGEMRMYTVNSSPLVAGTDVLESFWLAVCATFSREEYTAMRGRGGWIVYAKSVSFKTNKRKSTHMAHSVLRVSPADVKTSAKWDMAGAYDAVNGMWAPAYFEVASLGQGACETGSISISAKWQLAVGVKPSVSSVSDPSWAGADLSGSNDVGHHISFSRGWPVVKDGVVSSAGISISIRLDEGDYRGTVSVKGDWAQSSVNRMKDAGNSRRGRPMIIPGVF